MNITGEEKIRKLKDEFAVARSPKHKCSLLIDLAMELRNSNPAASLEESQKALEFAGKIDFLLGKARSYFCMGLAHFNLTDYENAFISLGHAWQAYKEAGDKWGMSNALNHTGLIYLRLGEYMKALENFSSSLTIKKESHDLFGTANVMISMAVIHRETGNPSEAQLLLMESLKISEEQEFNAIISKALMEMGITLMTENKFQPAAEKFNAAKLFFEGQNNTAAMAQCFLYLGKVESAAGATEQAVELFTEGQRMASLAGDKNLLTVCLCSIAAEKVKSGLPLEAIVILQEARTIALKTQEKPMLAVISQQLSAAHEITGELKEALLEYKNYIDLKEEINSVETTTRLRNLQISSKVEVLEKENKWLETERMAAVHELTALLNMQEIKSLNAMMEGQENERRRIAADLHDRIGSALSAIKLHLTGFALSMESTSQKQMEFGKVIAMFDEAVKEVRQVSHDLASGVLIKFGLAPALKDLCESIQHAGSIKVSFFTGGFDGRVDQRTEIALYRITQELISNILKHARAQEINIYLHRQDDHLSLMVEDDGIGFDPGQSSDGIGMQNIRWRANQLKGTVLVDSLPGKGCTITIEIPIPKL